MKISTKTSGAFEDTESSTSSKNANQKFTIVQPESAGLSRGAWEMFQNPKILDIYAEHYRWDVLEYKGMLLVVKNLPAIGLLRAQVFSPEAADTSDWHDQLLDIPAGYVSIMTNQQGCNGHVGATSPDDTYSFIVDLRLDSEVLFTQCERRSRKAIRHAKRNGMEVNEAQSRKEIPQFHELMMRTSDNGKRFHVPPLALLESLFDKGYGRLYVSYVKGNMAGGVYVLCDNYVHGLVSGFDVLAAGGLSSNLLYWESLLAEKEKKCSFFDFGTQSLTENTQLVKFKRSFSPMLIPAYHYEYYPSYWRSIGYRTWQCLKQVKGVFGQRF